MRKSEVVRVAACRLRLTVSHNGEPLHSREFDELIAKIERVVRETVPVHATKADIVREFTE